MPPGFAAHYPLTLLFRYLFIALMMQERNTVDRKCSVADSQKIKDDTKPIVCSDIDGWDISNESKRDVGMMLDVIITYKNKCFPAPPLAVKLATLKYFTGRTVFSASFRHTKISNPAILSTQST